MARKTLEQIRQEKSELLAKLEAQEEAILTKRRDRVGRIADTVGAIELDDEVIRGALLLAVEDETMRARFRDAGSRKASKRAVRSDAPSPAPTKAPESETTDRPAAGGFGTPGAQN